MTDFFDDLMLTGRPASRTQQRLSTSSARSRKHEELDGRNGYSFSSDDEDLLFSPHPTNTYKQIHTGTGSLQTLSNASTLQKKTRMSSRAKQYNPYETIGEEREPFPSNSEPQYHTKKTKNRYRILRSNPTTCDEMLFGQPSNILPEKEWKAPWDKSRNVQPLVFDSTDRTGFYSHTKLSALKTDQHKQKKPWR